MESNTTQQFSRFYLNQGSLKPIGNAKDAPISDKSQITSLIELSR